MPEPVTPWPERVRDALERLRETATSAGMSAGEVQALLDEALGADATTVRRPGADLAPTIAAALPQRPDTSIGRDVGRYGVLHELGHGGMGVVYRAHDKTLGRYVALKVLSVGDRPDRELLDRFQREARAAAAMDHPHIVKVLDVGELPPEREGEPGKPFYTMELLSGEDLAHAIGGGSITPREAVEVTRQVALALAYAHGRGVLHRDVKPQNVFLRADAPTLPTAEAPTVQVDAARMASARTIHGMLVDFGLAKFVEREYAGAEDGRRAESLASLTQSGQVLGTPVYMAPEQVKGSRDVDARADVYALGATLYHMLTGQPPITGNSLGELLQAVQTVEPVSPRKRNARVDRDLETLCLKCLAKEPAGRYAAAADLAEDCRRYLTGEPLIARPVGMMARCWRRVRRAPIVSGLAAALVIATVTVGIVQWRSVVKEREAERAHSEMVAGYLRELGRSGRPLVDAALGWRAAGDLMKSRSYGEHLEALMEVLFREAPRLAEPWYHRGRMQRALMHFADAEAAQDRAVELARAPDATPGSSAVLEAALYERGVLRMQRWRRALEENTGEILRARAMGGRHEGPAPAAPTEAEVASIHPEMARLKAFALEDLRAAAGVEPSAAAALTAVLEGDARAEELLRQTLQADCFKVEVYEALARLAVERGDREGAATWYEEGHQRDRGYLPYLTNLAATLGEAWLEHPSTQSDLIKRALVAADRALSLDPGNSRAWYAKCPLLTAQVFEAWVSGEKGRALDTLNAALRISEKALALEPSLAADVCNVQGILYRSLADAKWMRRDDPSVEWKMALERFDDALARDPQHYSAAHNAGALHQLMGYVKRSRGEDPTSDFERALSAFGRALAAHPRDSQAAHGMANAHKLLGEMATARGEDPLLYHEAALGGYQRSLSIDPLDAGTIDDLADLHLAMGDAAHRRGDGGRVEYEQAIAGYEESLALSPQQAEVATALASTWECLGNLTREEGGDPSEEYEKAVAACDRALSVDPRFTAALRLESQLYHSLSHAFAARGLDPSTHLERGIAALDATLAIDPSIWEAQVNRGCYLEELGRFEEAISAYEAALRLRPGQTVAQHHLDAARAKRAGLPSTSVRELAEADAALARGDYPGAGAIYERALLAFAEEVGRLSDADRSARSAEAATRAALARAHYNLACIRSLASAGIEAPGKPARAVDADTAARLREEAFRQLRQAIAHGNRDARQIAEDPDLSPLHADARWKELMENLCK